MYNGRTEGEHGDTSVRTGGRGKKNREIHLDFAVRSRNQFDQHRPY